MQSSAQAATFLMFEGRAEEAARFYVSLFPDGRIDAMTRYGPGEPGPEGTVMHGAFTLGGQRFMCSDSFVSHGFGFTPSVSIFVTCAEASETDRLFAALSDGGVVMMPLDSYPFSRRFGWVQDRFGVSWQLSLGA